MRVLLELISGDLRTGAANDSLDLATLGRPLGLDLLLCGRIDEAFAAEATRRGLALVPGRSRFLSKAGAALYAANVLRWMVTLARVKPDVVHLDYSGWGPSLACAAHLRRIPVVGRAGGGYHPDNLANRWIEAYVANCEPHAASLLNSPLARKVAVTGSLFRVDRLEAPRLLQPLPPRVPGAVRILFLGQLVHRKGIDVLVEALARMAVDAELLLVGGDWNQDGFPRRVRDLIARLGLAERVRLENHRPDAPALVGDCDVFVLPSRSDARPRSIIEAMYLGKPVVATRVGGVPTLVEHGVTGLLVPPDDPDALAFALDRLAADRALRQRMGAAAQAWAQAEVQPVRAVQAHIELYQRLAADHDTRRAGRRGKRAA